jgi:crotonobetainyl-CoA:carnitine CoA-transferase CaiB-like acyl-CoA transferase
MDYLGLARSGIMNAMGEPGMDPLGVVGGLADQMGAIVTAYGVLAAVVARERYGVGQEVDVSHLGSMTALQALNVAAACLLGRELPRQERAMAFNPLWNHYQCGDKRWLALAHLQPDRYWPDFCRAMGVPELESDPRFEDAQCREENGGELVAILDKIFATRSCDDWLAHLKKTGDFICTRVNTVTDLVKDPQIIENEYIQDFDHPVLGKIKIVGLPVRLSKTPGSVRLAAPDFGQHTEEVLQEVAGYTWEEIEKLKQEGVI